MITPRYLAGFTGHRQLDNPDAVRVAVEVGGEDDVGHAAMARLTVAAGGGRCSPGVSALEGPATGGFDPPD